MSEQRLSNEAIEKLNELAPSSGKQEVLLYTIYPDLPGGAFIYKIILKDGLTQAVHFVSNINTKAEKCSLVDGKYDPEESDNDHCQFITHNKLLGQTINLLFVDDHYKTGAAQVMFGGEMLAILTLGNFEVLQ
ncbi:MAG: hypothetical protein OXR68_06975 [Alphaproteobacteria bacterium]|nr:hypothetical protein [Alphaproteobacteria bacterium]